MISKDIVSKVRQRLQRDGLKGTVSSVAEYARNRAYLDETHVWYELALGADRPRRELPPELTLIRASTEHLPLIEQLPTLVESEARRRMERGAELWMVLEGDSAAFACWIFRGSMPVLAAPGGTLEFPPRIVCLEDSVTSSAYRGRSVAPAAWSQIADSLEQAGVESIITKIDENNVPSRRAVEKVGFREIATMRYRRQGLSHRTTVTAGTTGETAESLAENLRR